jgi:MFS family permease
MGGKLISYGRRTTMLACCMIGTLGAAFTLVQTVEFLLVGRTIFGFAAGIQCVATPRMVQDYMPTKWKTQTAVVWNVAQGLGAFIGLCSGLLLPSMTESPQLII